MILVIVKEPYDSKNHISASGNKRSKIWNFSQDEPGELLLKQPTKTSTGNMKKKNTLDNYRDGCHPNDVYYPQSTNAATHVNTRKQIFNQGLTTKQDSCQVIKLNKITRKTLHTHIQDFLSAIPFLLQGQFYLHTKVLLG